VELKRRNVYKVAVAYAVVGWLLVQVATDGRNVLCRIQVYLKAWSLLHNSLEVYRGEF